MTFKSGQKSENLHPILQVFDKVYGDVSIIYASKKDEIFFNAFKNTIFLWSDLKG
jgi:hypothetical protein